MKHKYFLVLAVLLSCNVWAQLDSVKVLPANPTDSDSIKLIGYKTFSTHSCSMLGKLITTPTTGEIYIDACHDDSLISQSCSSIDTITLAPLAGGNYKIGYIIRRVNFATDPPTCGGSPIADSTNVYIAVTSTAGIAKNGAIKNAVSIYPNPASEIIAVKYDLEENFSQARIVIYNLVGQKVQQLKLDNEKGVVYLNITQLNGGSYYLRVESPANQSSVHRFQKIN